jgi:hypothetical protein
MADDLQLAIFAAVIAAFVFCGCLVTRARKNTQRIPPSLKG